MRPNNSMQSYRIFVFQALFRRQTLHWYAKTLQLYMNSFIWTRRARLYLELESITPPFCVHSHEHLMPDRFHCLIYVWCLMLKENANDLMWNIVVIKWKWSPSSGDQYTACVWNLTTARKNARMFFFVVTANYSHDGRANQRVLFGQETQSETWIARKQKKRTDSKEAKEKNHYSGNEKKIEMRGRKSKMMNKYEVRVSDFIPIVVDSLAICVFSRWCVVKSLTFRSFVIFFVPSLVSFYMCYTRWTRRWFSQGKSFSVRAREATFCIQGIWRCNLVPINLNPIFCCTFGLLLASLFFKRAFDLFVLW